MPLDFSDLIPAKAPISFDDLIPKQADPSSNEASTQSARPPIEPDASQRIAAAGVQGAAEGFGHPMGQTILSPEAQDWMDAKQREGGVGGFLAGLGSTAAEDIGTGLGVVGGVGNAVFRGAQGAVAQTGAELGAPQLGRDVAAIPEAFMGSPGMLARAPELGVLPTDRPYIPRSVAEGNQLLDFPRSPDLTVTARQIQARDGVGIMEAWNRAHAENNAAAIAKIGQATDIDGAIAAAGKAAEAPSASTLGDLFAPSAETAAIPSGWTVDDRFGPTPGPDAPAEASPYVPITSSQVQRRDGVGAIEAGRRADAENAANAPAPQSVGAAASRDLTQPDLMNEITPAQKATALQKMVNQSAEDRLTPQGRDDNVYFPGVERPEAMRDFTPAADGDVSSALEHKVLYNTDSNYHDQYDTLVKKNNNVMVDGLHDMFGDANARDAAMNEAKELMPGPTGLFDGEQPVDAQPIVDRIKKILASPAGKRDAVASQLNRILPKLYDADGNLETLPSQLKGIRDDITDKLYDKTPTVEGNAARTASTQLRSVLGIVDEQIGSGLPGTTYQDYLANLSAALGQVSKLDYLQKFLTGPRKLTDLAGNLQFGKVQKMLEDIQAHHADQTGGAKELSMPEINQIEAVRNELAAKDLLDRRAGVRGSPTAQITNAMGILGSGPLGAGVKGAGELALHAGLAAKTGGVGNAALLGYRYIVKPGMEAAKARDAAAVLAATKQRLLDTTPRPGP